MQNLHPLIRAELDNLSLAFPGQSQINMDEYAWLYKISRRAAVQHLKRLGIPYTKEGRQIFVSLLDLAKYKAQRKHGINLPSYGAPVSHEQEMKNRRGFAAMALKKQLTG